ncbi:MAG: 4Fe-4S binding protein, partial [Thermoplasmata archaeon]|nr:4Fe-4S binding protein [Thermoplasmata archaeon]NIS12111.1 4Fe-4S binding protein [Thermoplasmata archaeon]NIS20035.1 4Fe-4S binding protein [Thermoplasmata archaeon]NIT77232.1 4Fe-4S binding protein [Thermoplasmata archaeon]NIU49141.1 4Fe-4S binding protein [Thermoplasmata archaeon]
MPKPQNVGIGVVIVAIAFMALIAGIVRDSTPLMVVSSYSLVISTLIMVITLGSPLLRLPVQVLSFGTHRLGIFRKLPGGWHAEIPRTAGVSCTLNCQACELAWIGCPIGMLQQFVLSRAVPFYIIGVFLIFGATLGRTVCGWLCPFGLILDIVNKACTHKYEPPNWLRIFKYIYLIGLIILAYVTISVFYCRYFCFGAVLGIFPYWLTWNTVSWMWLLYHLGVFAAYITFAYFTHGRAWCRYFCPLGGALALFAPFSLMKIKHDWKWCTDCKECV